MLGQDSHRRPSAKPVVSTVPPEHHTQLVSAQDDHSPPMAKPSGLTVRRHRDIRRWQHTSTSADQPPSANHPYPERRYADASACRCTHSTVNRQPLLQLKQSSNGDTSELVASEAAKGRRMHVQAVLGTQPCAGSCRPISDEQTLCTYRSGRRCVRFGRPAVFNRGWPVVPVGATCVLSEFFRLTLAISGV